MVTAEPTTISFDARAWAWRATLIPPPPAQQTKLKHRDSPANVRRRKPCFFSSGAMNSNTQPCGGSRYDAYLPAELTVGHGGTVNRKGAPSRHRGCKVLVGVDRSRARYTRRAHSTNVASACPGRVEVTPKVQLNGDIMAGGLQLSRSACRCCLLVLAGSVVTRAFFVAPCSLRPRARAAPERQHRTRARAGLSMVIPPAE